MLKTQNIDKELFLDKVNESGLKHEKLYTTLGISKSAYYNKVNGLTPFRTAEIFVLCVLLNITDAGEKQKIFYP